MRPTRVLCSVTNLNGLTGFVASLIGCVPEVVVYCTSGTKARLEGGLAPEEGSHLRDINDFFPTPRQSRDVVKTIDWRIFLGILGDPNREAHQEALRAHKIALFDMVVVNWYREAIDIGGPALLRAAAKNYRRVIAVSSPRQYNRVLAEMRANDGRCGVALRRVCARRVFGAAARYNRWCRGMVV